MTSLLWLRGLILRRPSRLIATSIGVALAVALIASIGTFLSSTTAHMTARAAVAVPVDWQVEVQSPSALALIRRTPGVVRALPVRFAATTGLRASTGGTVQTTGPGQVVGLPAGYSRAFPGELRTLAGSGSGVLLAQQTAANLHAQPGDQIAIGRPDAAPARVTVDGIVELPAADSLFQRVGAPSGAQPSAPPDNVILLPEATFASIEPSARTQIHVGLDSALPASPSAAYRDVTARARNLESALA